MQFYCVKCRKKVETNPTSSKKQKNGALMHKGKCPRCSTTVARFGKA